MQHEDAGPKSKEKRTLRRNFSQFRLRAREKEKEEGECRGGKQRDT